MFQGTSCPAPALRTAFQRLAEHFGLNEADVPEPFAPRFNVAPKRVYGTWVRPDDADEPLIVQAGPCDTGPRELRSIKSFQHLLGIVDGQPLS